LSNPIWERLRGEQDVFSSVFAYSRGALLLNSSGEARTAQVDYTSGGFFETLGIIPVLGRTYTSQDDRRGCAPTMVLGFDFWQTEFGGRRDIVGKAVRYDTRVFEILGVLSPGFTGVDVGTKIDAYVTV